MSIWKVHKEVARVPEPGPGMLEEYELELSRTIVAAMQAGDGEKAAGECIWPACGHGQARGDYCLYHHDLLVGAGCIEDKDYARRWDQIFQSARAKVAALFPRNPDFQKWDEDD